MVKRVLLLVLVLVLLVSMFGTHEAWAGSTKVSWVPKTIEVELFPGTSSVATATFMSDQDLSDVSLWLVPELQGFFTVEPSSFASINATTPYSVALFVSVPSDTPLGVYSGTLHVRTGSRTVPQTLKVILNVKEPTAEDIPADVALPSADRLCEDPETGAVFAQGEIVVGFVPGTSEVDIRATIAEINGVFLGGIPALVLYQVQVPVTDTNQLDELIQELELREIVSFATLHWLDEIDRAPDPGRDPKSGVWDETSPAGNNWGHEFIRLPSAWDITTGSQQTKIAVVDTGFYIGHEDFGDNIVYSENPDGNMPKYNYLLWEKATNHGTHVAGIVGSQGNNDKGITGVMWDCSLLLYGYTDPGWYLYNPFELPRLDSLVATSHMMDAIDRGAKVINYSAGRLHSNAESARRASEVYARAIWWAQHKDKEVLFVFSAGNDATDVSLRSPANLAADPRYDNVVAVAAIAKDGSLTSFSNFGSGITVAAPGEGIYSTIPGTLWGMSGYDDKSGTSQAAPFVSGLAGLIWSVNPDFTAAEVKQLIIVGAEAEAGSSPVPGHSFYVINAYESVKKALISPVVLYAGGNNPGVVYQYLGGTDWEIISPELGYAVMDLIEYEGHLYAAVTTGFGGYTGVGKVYRHDGDNTWTLVGDGMDHAVISLAIYHGELYAGTGRGSFRLYRYTPGTTNCGIANWTRIVNYGWNGVRSLYVSRGYLLMGDAGSDYFGHWDGSNFYADLADGGSCIYDYQDYGDYVYAAAYVGRLWRSSDGIHWGVVLDYYDGNMWELEEFQDELYMSYNNGELRASSAPDRGRLVYPASDGIISMITDGNNLYFGTGGDAVGWGPESSGIASVYKYDGSSVVLISDEDEMVTGVQVLYLK